MNKEWTVYNTRTGVKVRNYHYAESHEVFEAMDQLHLGFKWWKKIGLKSRQEKLFKLIEIVEKDKVHLAQTISQEMSKPLEASEAEVQKCIDTSKYLCRLDLSFLEPQEVYNTTYEYSQVSKEPLGIILSILPWNFPAWQGFRAFFPALLAGNTILIKHSEVTPTVGDLIENYFDQAGLGSILKHRLFSHEITENVISHPLIGGVSLTGSVTAGKTVATVCSRYLKKCVLELGGSDPSLVLEDCDLDQAVRAIARGRLQNAGQVCISAKRVLAPRVHLNLICEKLIAAFEEILEGQKEMVGPLAEARFKSDYNTQVNELKKHSKVIYEKEMDSLNQNQHMAFVNPCILLFEKNEEILKTTEVFGPCLIVIPYHSVDEAIEIANSTLFGLGASVYGNDIDHCQNIASEIESGQVVINETVKSDIRLPFGGYKMSGLGRESGHEGFFEFTQTRVISIKK